MERFLPRAVAVLGVWALTHGSASAQGERIYTYERTTSPLVLTIDELHSTVTITNFCNEGLFEVDWIREGRMGGPELLEFRSIATSFTAEGRAGTRRPQLLMEPKPDAGSQRTISNILPGDYLLYFDPDNNLERVGRVGWEPIKLTCGPNKKATLEEAMEHLVERDKLRRLGYLNPNSGGVEDYYRAILAGTP